MQSPSALPANLPRRCDIPVAAAALPLAHHLAASRERGVVYLFRRSTRNTQ